MRNTVFGNELLGALLSDIAEVRSGYQARNRIEPDADSPFRIIQLRDIDHAVSWPSLLAFVPEYDPKRYIVTDGDVLLSCRGGAHVGLALSGVPANTVASGNFYILRIRRQDVLPEYLGWYLNQPAAQFYFRTRSQGTRTALLTKADVAELEVPIPPRPVQEGMVRLADLRRTERDLLRRLESRKDFLIQSLCQRALLSTPLPAGAGRVREHPDSIHTEA